MASRLTDTVRTTGELADTTRHLREALASPKARGQWGERMADDVLRARRLGRGRQLPQADRHRRRARSPTSRSCCPASCVLHMDVKFPVDNYLRSLEAATRRRARRPPSAFLRDVRGRVKELAGRGYIDADTTVDQVLLFIPNESVYAFIHEHDPAADRRRPRPEGRALLAVHPVRGAGRHPPGGRRSPTSSARRDEILQCLGAFGEQWDAVLRAARSAWASGSTPRSGPSRISPAPGGASSTPARPHRRPACPSGLAPAPEVEEQALPEAAAAG